MKKVEKLVANLHDKTEYVFKSEYISYDTHKKFKTSIKSWISLEKVYKEIKFNQNAWLKPYIDMNTDLRKEKKKMILKKIFLSS